MKIICIGRNYADHINELKNNRPTEPVIFLKTDTSVILKNQPFFFFHIPTPRLLIPHPSSDSYACR